MTNKLPQKRAIKSAVCLWRCFHFEFHCDNADRSILIFKYSIHLHRKTNRTTTITTTANNYHKMLLLIVACKTFACWNPLSHAFCGIDYKTHPRHIFEKWAENAIVIIISPTICLTAFIRHDKFLVVSISTVRFFTRSNFLWLKTTCAIYIWFFLACVQ